MRFVLLLWRVLVLLADQRIRILQQRVNDSFVPTARPADDELFQTQRVAVKYNDHDLPGQPSVTSEV